MFEFAEIEKKIEEEASAICGRRKKIEQEALRVFSYFDTDISEATKAELTAKRLVNASVWSSQQGDNIKAMAALRVATEIDGNCWEAYCNLGSHYLSMGMKLHEPFMSKTTIASDGEKFYKSLANRTSFYEAALKYLEKTLNLKPENAKAWCALGMTKYYMRNYDEARTALQKAIALDPVGEGGKMATQNLIILENSLK